MSSARPSHRIPMFLALGALLVGGAWALAAEPPLTDSPPTGSEGPSEAQPASVLTVGSPALRYPDLRVVPADDLIPGIEMMNGRVHNVVRFSATIWNGGEGPLEIRGDSSSGTSQVYQRVYDPDGRVTEFLAGSFVYHEGHNHWHFENFARYELWTHAAYERWRQSGDTDGAPEWLGSKTTGIGESYCVRDSRPMDGFPSAPFRYATCDADSQGISVGWADIYGRELPDQWVDVGERPLPDGDYVLRIVADPLNLLHESENRANPERDGPRANEGVTRFALAGGVITLTGR